MRKSRERDDPLFSALERTGLATVVVLLFIFGVMCMGLGRMNPDPTTSRLKELTDLYWQRFFGRWLFQMETVGQLIWCGGIVLLWIDTFLRLRRFPLAVTRNIAFFVGCLCMVILWRGREDLSFIVSGIQELGPRVDWRAYSGFISDISGHFLSLALTVATVVFGGELSQESRRRILYAEWRAQQNAPEEVRLRCQRREALILAVRGPRLPISSAIVRSLALVLAPFMMACGVTHLAEAMDYLPKSLPAPQMLKAGPAAIELQPLTSRIWIDADNRIYFGGDLAAPPRDTDCERLVRWLKRSAAGSEKSVLLQIHPEVRFDRVVDVLSAAHRAKVRLALEE